MQSGNMVEPVNQAHDQQQYGEQFKFRWADLPLVSDDVPGTGGEIRAQLDDFVVDEIPAYLPDGEGQHAYALVEKRGLTSNELVIALKRRGVPQRDVGIAGLKDKFAVTSQWISVPVQHEKRLESLDEEEGVKVLEMSRHRNKLGTGHLHGNKFSILVRNPQGDWQQALTALTERLSTIGVPNYFGPQRFGRFNTNVVDGLRLVRGGRVPGNKRFHRLLISALQSHLFNWLLKSRIEAGLYQSVIAGDMAKKHDTGGVFLVEDGDEESPRALRLEISATLPLFGERVKPSEGKVGEMESAVLERFGMTREDFRSVSGDRRISRLVPDGLSAEAKDDGFLLRFSLPKGAFATAVLREIMKTDVDSREAEA